MKQDGQLGLILLDLRGAVRSLLQSITTVTGYAVILGWYVYFKYIRLKLAGVLPRLLTMMATIDFVGLLLEKVQAMHEKAHQGKAPISGAHVWLDGVGARLEQFLENFASYNAVRSYLQAHAQLVVFAASGVTLILAYIVYKHHHRMTKRVQQHLEF